MIVKTSILPNKQIFAKKLDTVHELDYKAICVFVSTGFFMGEDTYYKDEVCLRPGHKYTLNEKGEYIQKTPYFKWHYSPRQISFKQALDEYVQLLSKITKEQVGDNPVILALSGGLDSRSQALVLKDLDNKVHSYSYAFSGGYPEHKISKRIAEVCGFSYEGFQINKGYLWDCIDELAEIVGCYSEFTHPRQMAILKDLKQMKGVFSLGHWGDVLFDRGVPEGTLKEEIVPILFKKMIKPKGFQLAEQLWELWQLNGDFKTYLTNRIKTDLDVIEIDNISAKVRAYKTSQWAHRWTTTNLSVFQAAHPVTLPFYDDRMCKFICSIPEDYLADRRLQIAHLEQNNELANITWHANKPYNLTNYHKNKTPFNIPHRMVSKLKRIANALIGKPYIQRNWELQFIGSENEQSLESHIYNTDFNTFIPKTIVQETYKNFKTTDAINYAHPVSILLTLSLWHQKKSKTDI